MNMKISWVIKLSLLLASISTSSGFAIADELLCRNNEYAFTASNNPAAHERIVDLVESVSSLSIKVSLDEVTKNAILLDLRGKAERSSGTDNDAWVPCKDLCAKIENEGRNELRSALQQMRSSDPDARPSINSLRRDFSSCAPNMELKAFNVPNDALYSLLYGMNNIKAPQAWDRSIGSRSVVVGVIDSGIDINHPDLVGNLWSNSGETPGNGIDDDGNGVIDDIHGYNAITNGALTGDDNGHGTHCSGTIGAVGGNSIGVAGVSWQVKLVGAKFLDSGGHGSSFGAVKAVDYMTNLKNRGVNIITTNNSWGGGEYFQPLYDAINRARQAGILFVAAAGNDANNNDANPSYPAGYNLDNIISVAAVDSSDNLASFSNYGASSVDIAAPGVNIASTYPNRQYVWSSGTSMAAPHVSGVVALLKAYNPSLVWNQIRDAIYEGSDTVSNINGRVVGARRLNALNALLSTPANAPVPTPSQTPTLTPTPTPLPPTPTPTATPTPSPGAWSISGTVNLNGVPLAGAEVLLTTTSGFSELRITGPSGEYNFPAISGPVNYTVKASYAGASPISMSAYLYANANHSFNLSATQYDVIVKAVNSGGSPMYNVAVTVSGQGTKLTDINGTAIFKMYYGDALNASATLDDYTFSILKDSGSASGSKVLGSVTRVFLGTSSWEQD